MKQRSRISRFWRWLVLTLFVLALFPVCSRLGIPTFGLSGVGRSESIEESKRRGVFVAEYDVSPRVIVVNDRCTLKFTDAWLERQWKPGCFNNLTVTYPNGYCDLLWHNEGTPSEMHDFHDKERYFPVLISLPRASHGAGYYNGKFNDGVGKPPKKIYQYVVAIGRNGLFRWDSYDTAAILTFTAKQPLPSE